MVGNEEPQFIAIEYCDSSDCPGCPPFPECACASPVQTLDIQNSETLDTLTSEPVGTPPVEREQALKGIGRVASKKWYEYRPNPRRQSRGQNRRQNGGKHCGQVEPIEPVETVPCMCPLILCAAPPLCPC